MVHKLELVSVGDTVDQSPAMPNAVQFRRDLFRWYARHKRDLPWRRDCNAYRVWVSEIMLQQTRVNAVIPYYERFLARFPSVEVLASAGEQDLLAAWAGLGYYSRARNMQAAAKLICERGVFPREYQQIRNLPGVGDYTAAALASIAFGQRRAALDGNVNRVLSRVLAETGDTGARSTRGRLQAAAEQLLDPKQPGEFNQAMMELGATLCVPAQPRCLLCPIAGHCEARRMGRQEEFPIKRKRSCAEVVEKKLVIVSTRRGILVWQRGADSTRLAGFWELPEPAQLPGSHIETRIGQFRHTIVNTSYRFEVLLGTVREVPAEFCYLPKKLLDEVPLSTTAKKALACLQKWGQLPLGSK